jgi:hypothetical protein
MIQITCTSCKRMLSIDDAFAGGVCRCQYCGTIQTVAAKGASQKTTAGTAKGPKTLFENKARGVTGVGSGSGLEDLAGIVQSSSGLSDPNLRKPPPKAAPPPRNLTPILGIAAAVIVVLLIAVLLLAFHGSSNSNPAPSVSNTGVVPNPDNTPTPPPAAPAFCGVPINQSVVVYLIDNGASSADVLDEIKTALFKSIDSLGPDRRFQIVFWNPDSDSYPASGFTFAVKENIDVARKKLADVTAAGSTDPIAGLKTALADNPGQIFLVTAKAGDLDDSLVSQVAALRGSSAARIDCIAVNGVPSDKVLSKIAAQSGGVFLPLPESQLKSFTF